jgi:hypothetical protein
MGVKFLSANRFADGRVFLDGVAGNLGISVMCVGEGIEVASVSDFAFDIAHEANLQSLLNPSF